MGSDRDAIVPREGSPTGISREDRLRRLPVWTVAAPELEDDGAQEKAEPARGLDGRSPRLVVHGMTEIRQVGAAAAVIERDLPPLDARPLPQTSVTVLVAAPMRLYRDGLAAILAHQEGIEVAGIAGDCGDTLVRWLELAPDVVLVDLALEGSVETIRWLAVQGGRSGAGVVVLASSDTEDQLVGCAQAGVFNFVTRDDSIADLVLTLRKVAVGEVRIPPETAAATCGRLAGGAIGRNSMPQAQQRLTPREIEVMKLIEQGLSNKQIAHRLSVALSTVKQHVHHILEKLEVSRRGEAVARIQRSRA